MSLELSRVCTAISPSPTLAIDSKAKALRAEGRDVISFCAGEPDFMTPQHIRTAAHEALDMGLTKYTPSAGTLELRKAICHKLLIDNDLSYVPTQIIVSNGAKFSVFAALRAIINPGDEILIPSPCWVSYPEIVRMVGGVPVFVNSTEEDGFLVTAEALAACVTDKTKALILNTPNNPCGSVMPRERLEQIARLAVEKQFYVISDEIYEKLIYDGREHVSIASLGEDIKAQTILVNGVSKSYAMTGWRIGYIAAPRALVKAMTSFQSHATSNPNSIAQYAAAEAMINGSAYIKSMVGEFDARRRLMHRLINDIDGLSCNLPEGAFYVMMNISSLIGKSYKGQKIDGSLSFADILLTAKNVAVVPAKAFGTDMHVRLSYATAQDRIEQGLARIAEFVAECE